MKENSVQEYEVQRPQFFHRKSLSCKWRWEWGWRCCCLRLCVLGCCQEQPNGHTGSGAELPGCWHPITTFVHSGTLLGVFMIFLTFSTSLLFGSFAKSVVCYLCCFKCQQLNRILPFKSIIYPAQMEHSCFSIAVDSSVFRFVFRSEMCEKVTCCFSLSNLEFYSELPYKIIFQRSIEEIPL